MTPEEALPMLKHQCCGGENPSLVPAIQALAEQLSRKVPLWQMQCTKDPAAARVSFEAMSK